MVLKSVAILFSAAALFIASPSIADDNAPGPEDAAHITALSEMSMGAEDAPITVIEYASLTCPHCAHFHHDAFPRLKDEYIDTGKVRFVLREMPVIPGHPVLIARSYAGTMLARCAADKGGAEAYFAVMDQLFAEQEDWAFGEDAKAALLNVAASADMDPDAFEACLKRADLKAYIDATVQKAGDEFAIQSTPSFVINGEYSQISDFDALFKALDNAALTEN